MFDTMPGGDSDDGQYSRHEDGHAQSGDDLAAADVGPPFTWDVEVLSGLAGEAEETMLHLCALAATLRGDMESTCRFLHGGPYRPTDADTAEMRDTPGGMLEGRSAWMKTNRMWCLTSVPALEGLIFSLRVVAIQARRGIRAMEACQEQLGGASESTPGGAVASGQDPEVVPDSQP